MLTTVHLADLGLRSYRRWRRAVPRPDTTPGLRYVMAPTPAPLGTRGPRPQFGRLGMLAFWDDDASARRFLDGTLFEAGWSAHLSPVRAIGTWPGLPVDLPTAPDPVHDGPSFVITLGRLRLTQAHRFFPTSAKAEAHVLASPGLTWASGAADPLRRTLATLSWWHDFTEMDRAVRGAGDHAAAMREQERKDFHHQSAFIRFRILDVTGRVEGPNSPPEHLP